MARMMGCTQVDTITGPMRSSTFFIPSDRTSRPGRRGLFSLRKGGRRMAPCKNQPSR